MNSEDKFKIECELLEYFTQFHDKGVKISLFKGKTEVPVKVDNNGNPNEIITKDNADGIYFVPPVENDVYNAELFETFYQLLLSNQTAPEPLFLKREFEIISGKYSNEAKKDFPILDYWLYFLQEKLKEINKPIEDKKNKSTKKPKTFESFFIRPEYITIFYNALEEKGRLSKDKLLITNHSRGSIIREIVCIIEVLRKKGYIENIKPSHRRIFAEKITGQKQSDDGEFRKKEVGDTDKEALKDYSSIIPNLQ